MLVSHRGRQELDPLSHYLDRVAPTPILLPGPRLQSPDDADSMPLREILGAELALPLPGRDPDEVRACLTRAAAHGEQEARHLLVLVADLAKLDFGREIADQVHAVHGTDGRRPAVTEESRLRAGSAPRRAVEEPQLDWRAVMGIFSSMTGFGGR